jgi:ATP-dependent Clp protease ATP-binding subunit ClpA
LEYLQPTSSTASSAPKLSDFKKLTDPDAAKVELPLAAALQQTLFDAGQISNSMGASAIEPHHVFLALLNYKEVGETGEAQAATRSDDCEAMEILYHLDATLEGEDICFSLLQTLLQQQQQQQQQQQKEKEKEGASNNASKDEDASSSASSSSSAAASSSSSSSKEPIISGTGAAMSEAKEKARSLLQECGVDLTLMAREGQLDKVHGRDAEIQACFQTLVRRRKNNVCLIGEAGVGKTCIVEQLAQILVTPELCPPFLEGHRIISLEVGALLAGTKFRGEFEERLRTIIEILSNSRTKSILFIDEIHNLVGAGGNSEGNMDASNILKPYLARGQLQVIGATTITEYNRHIAKDAALERRFQPVLIREPTVEETVDILNAVLPFYRSHHKVEYTNSSLEAAARLSDRYINDRFLPDKAIDVLDEAGAMATLKRNRFDIEPPTVTDKSITDIISQWTNIPVGKLEMDEMDRLQLLEENLGRRVKGQERAVRTVAKAIRRARTGIRNPRRPVASFLFCGPTGTGTFVPNLFMMYVLYCVYI